MNKVTAFGASAAGIAFAMVGAASPAMAAPSGVPDVVGDTYADASSAITEADMTPVVGVVIGDKLPRDECIVTNAQPVSALRPIALEEAFPQYFPVEDEVVLTLNCNGDYATATNPGASVASPAGREAREAAEQAASAEEQELAEAATPGE
ncbi:hypothetical protein [Mycobacterium hubeiense]|uniref:hypothetical protein n=1 Tax=Mycobacterium hubeiense TaxID=1867256 RepID=UPI000C7E9EF9|nr:hypothetical protein [Mycobacterium sp. QGD 101]